MSKTTWVFLFFFKSGVILFASQEKKNNKIKQLKHNIVICSKINTFLLTVLGGGKPSLFM